VRFTPSDLQKAVIRMHATYLTNCDVRVEDVPKEILSLSSEAPSYIFVISREDEHRWELNVLWGGGFWTWGVVVCPPGYQVHSEGKNARIFYWNDGVAFVALR
jgi:hypothetical protein